MQIVTGLFLMFYDLLVQIAAKLRLKPLIQCSELAKNNEKSLSIFLLRGS